MSDLPDKRRAYQDWIATEGTHQAHTPDLVDAYVTGLEAEVERLQARERELRAVNERMRKVLAEILYMTYYKRVTPRMDLGWFAHQVNTAARAALDALDRKDTP